MSRVCGIDIGNGRIKIFPLSPDLSTSSSNEAQAPGRSVSTERPALVSTSELRSIVSDDVAEIWRALPAAATRPGGRLQVVSVRPDLCDALRSRAEAEGVALSIWTARNIPMGHPYVDPDRLGPDRLLAAWAARALHGDNLVVVDAGTAVTVDLVDAQGDFAGGAIAPGLPILSASLGAGAMLETARPDRELNYPGVDTAGALAAGALGALVGGTLELIARGIAALGGTAKVVMTGGDGGLIQREARERGQSWLEEPRLLEIGLALLEQREQGS